MIRLETDELRTDRQTDRQEVEIEFLDKSFDDFKIHSAQPGMLLQNSTCGINSHPVAPCLKFTIIPTMKYARKIKKRTRQTKPNVEAIF